MEITKEKIEQLQTLYDDLDQLDRDAIDAVNNAKLNKDLPVSRKQGKDWVSVSEKDLWDELYHLGPGSDAEKLLKEKYPWAFEALDKAKAKGDELSKFIAAELGINFRAIRVIDIIKLTAAVVEYKLNERSTGAETKA